MSVPARIFESLSGLVHSEGNGGAGYTLCGYSINGVNEDENWIPSTRRINCPDCVRLIAFCKAIPRRVVDWSEA